MHKSNIPVRPKTIPSDVVRHMPAHFYAHEYPYCQPINLNI